MVLWIAAAFIKPSVTGIFIGGLLHALVTRSTLRTKLALVGPASLFALAITATLHVGSGGQWVWHYRSAMLAHFSLEVWTGSVAHRMPFLAGITASTLLLVSGLQRNTFEGALLTVVTFTSLGVALVGLGKEGGALNYLMEFCIVALCVLRFTKLPTTGAGSWRWTCASAAMVFQLFWNAPVVLRDSVSLIRFAARQRNHMESAKVGCEAMHGNTFILSDRLGVQFLLNRRIHMHYLEFNHLIRVGRFPRTLIEADLASVDCFVQVRLPQDAEEGQEPLFLAVDGMPAYLHRHFSPAWTRDGVTLFLRMRETP
jgi:hypothetical protein